MSDKFNPQEYPGPMRPMGDDPGAIRDYRDALLRPPVYVPSDDAVEITIRVKVPPDVAKLLVDEIAALIDNMLAVRRDVQARRETAP